MYNIDEVKLKLDRERHQIDIKLKLLYLAKDIARDNKDEDLRKLYLELREEVLGIKNPNN